MPVSLNRKPVPLTAWQLTDQAQMLDALSFLSGQGWRGAISFNPNSEEWRLELNADNPDRHLVANSGEWLVVDMGLRLLSDSEFNDNYEVAD